MSTQEIKPGNIVTGTKESDDKYGITNTSMKQGVVLSINNDANAIVIEIVEHGDKSEIGNIYTVESQYFSVIGNAETKYKLSDECIKVDGKKLYRAIAVIDFGKVKSGDKGGFVESDANLPKYGNSWVSGNAKVWGDAKVSGNAEVSGNADYIVFKNSWSSGRWFTWTRSNNMWSVGCFYGTGDELVARAYKDSEKSGRNYKRYVDLVSEILKEKPE